MDGHFQVLFYLKINNNFGDNKNHVKRERERRSQGNRAWEDYPLTWEELKK